MSTGTSQPIQPVQPVQPVASTDPSKPLLVDLMNIGGQVRDSEVLLRATLKEVQIEMIAALPIRYAASLTVDLDDGEPTHITEIGITDDGLYIKRGVNVSIVISTDDPALSDRTMISILNNIPYLKKHVIAQCTNFITTVNKAIDAARS